MSALGLVVGLQLLLITPFSSARLATGDARLARADMRDELLAALNAVRAEHGLAPLELSGELDASAAVHSGEMIRDGYFGHDSAGGRSCFRRIERFYPALPGRSWAVGENLLWTAGPLDARRAVELWLASPGHRANMLSPLWRQVGIGVRGRTDAPGVYAGRAVTVLTVDFGARG